MKIQKLRIGHFGKFHDCEFDFASGMNLVYGENEAGKSTLHAFIRAMLFGFDKPRGRATKEDMYVRYQPWGTPGAYQGAMDFEHEGVSYRIYRTIYQKEKSCILTNLDTGKEINLPDGKITGLIPQLTESAYRNTISAEQQRVRTEATLAEEVRNYIANLSLAKTSEVDVAAALESLKAKRREITAAMPDAKCVELEKDISLCLERDAQLESLTEQRNQLAQNLSVLHEERKQQENSEEYKSAESLIKLPAAIEKARSFEEQCKDIEGLKERSRGYAMKLEELADGLDRIDIINEALVKVTDIRTQETADMAELTAKAQRADEEARIQQEQEEARIQEEAGKQAKAAEEYKTDEKAEKHGEAIGYKIDEMTEEQGEAAGCSEQETMQPDMGEADNEDRIAALRVKNKKLLQNGVIMAVLGILACALSNNRWQPGLFGGIGITLVSIVLIMNGYITAKDIKKREKAVIEKRHEAELEKANEAAAKAEEQVRRAHELAEQAKEKERLAAEKLKRTEETAAAARSRKELFNGKARLISEEAGSRVDKILTEICTDSVEEAGRELQTLKEHKLQYEQLARQNEQTCRDIEAREQRAERMRAELIEMAAAAGIADFGEVTDSMYNRLLALYEERKAASAAWQEQFTQLNKAIGDYNNQISRIDGSMDGFEGNETELMDKKQQLKELREILALAEKEQKAIDLAITTIKSLSDDIHDSFGRQLNKVLSELTAAVTNGRYREARVDKDMNIEVMDKIDYVSFDKLSTGTIEQMYLALRLAVSELFFEGAEVPLLLDESFAYYDEGRLGRTLQYLAGITKQQIILFTCHKREKELLGELGVSFTYNSLC